MNKIFFLIIVRVNVVSNDKKVMFRAKECPGQNIQALSNRSAYNPASVLSFFIIKIVNFMTVQFKI